MLAGASPLGRAKCLTRGPAGLRSKQLAQGGHGCGRCAAQPVDAPVDNVIKLELDTQEARASLRLQAVPNGRGQAIIVSELVQGSEAYELGVRQGHRVLAISDPVRSNQVIQLNELSSGRFVRDALKLRMGPTVRMDFDTSKDWLEGGTDGGSLARSGDGEQARAQTDSAEVGSSSSSSSSSSSREPGPFDPVMSASVSSSLLDAVLSLDDLSDDQSADESLTVAQRLEERYQRVQQRVKQQSVVQQRIDARKEYLSRVGGRGDAKLFAWAAFAVLFVPVTALVWAYSSGYLDSLARGYGGQL